MLYGDHYRRDRLRRMCWRRQPRPHAEAGRKSVAVAKAGGQMGLAGQIETRRH